MALRGLEEACNREARRFFQDQLLLEANEKVRRLYEQMLSLQARAQIERNSDHGWAHIRRVIFHLSTSMNWSAEARNRKGAEKHLNSPLMYDALALAARFHDVAEQLYHIKSKHAQLGALVVLYDIFNQYLLQLPDKSGSWLDLPRILFAVIMIYFHSSSKLITSEEININEESLHKECECFLEDAHRKGSISAEDYELLKSRFVSGHRQFHEAGLSQQRFLSIINNSLSSDDRFEMTELLFLARRLFAADKLDSTIPGEMANLRTIISSQALKLNRPFVSSHAFNNGDDPEALDAEIDSRVREAAIIAPDDFSRIVYEILAEYDELQLTAFEKRRLLIHQKKRAENLISLIGLMLESSASACESYLSGLFSGEFSRTQDREVRKMIAADKSKMGDYIRTSRSTIDQELLKHIYKLAQRVLTRASERLELGSQSLQREKNIPECSYYPDTFLSES